MTPTNRIAAAVSQGAAVRVPFINVHFAEPGKTNRLFAVDFLSAFGQINKKMAPAVIVFKKVNRLDFDAAQGVHNRLDRVRLDNHKMVGRDSGQIGHRF